MGAVLGGQKWVQFSVKNGSSFGAQNWPPFCGPYLNYKKGPKMGAIFGPQNWAKMEAIFGRFESFFGIKFCFLRSRNIFSIIIYTILGFRVRGTHA